MLQRTALSLALIALLANPELATSALAQQKQADAQVTAPENQPKHPSEAHGPHHTARGVIRNVRCSYPSVIEFRLVGEGKPLRLYNNAFGQIDLTVLGFNFSGPVNPCKDFEGKKAQIQYAESSDKTVDGKVLKVELRK